MNTDYYFPTPIWWIDTQVNILEMHDLYLKIRENDSGREMSNFGGWQGNDILEGDYQLIDSFIKLVEDYSAKCINDYGFAPSTKLKISNLWSKILSLRSSILNAFKYYVI